MDKIEFEEIVNHAFEHLPDMFKQNIDNVQFNIEDYPTAAQLSKLKIRSKYSLLGRDSFKSSRHLVWKFSNASGSNNFIPKKH
jgi:predicted Zn-dependent protease with MMP-like domain